MFQIPSDIAMVFSEVPSPNYRFAPVCPPLVVIGLGSKKVIVDLIDVNIK